MGRSADRQIGRSAGRQIGRSEEVYALAPLGERVSVSRRTGEGVGPSDLMWASVGSRNKATMITRRSGRQTASKTNPELTFWLSPVETIPSFASNGAQFSLQSVSSAPNCPSRSPANPFSPLLEPDFSDTAPFAVFPGIDFLGALPQPAALSCGDRESRHPLHHCSKQSPG